MKINNVIMIRTYIIFLALTSKLIVFINQKLCCFGIPVKTINVSNLQIIISLGSATLGFRP